MWHSTFAMNISRWLAERRTRGTEASFARRIAERGADYKVVERHIRHLYIVEALLANGGKHDATASALGIHRATISRALKEVGLTVTQVRTLAKQLGGGQIDGN